LVSSLLQVTRVSNGFSAEAADDISIDELVAEIVTTNALNAEEKQSRVVVSAESSSWVRGDKRLLTRALDNVLRNAIDYSPPDSQIDIVLLERSGRVEISVRDRGHGVPDAMLANIF